MPYSKKCRGEAALRPQSEPKVETSNDFVGYEVLIDFMRKRKLHRLEGDIIEIGAFMGGGTVKLAKFARKYDKRVYAVDIFEPGCDKTQDESGVKMCEIYETFLQGRSQLEVYQKTTHKFDNIVTINMDSRKVSFHKGQRFIFGFIDGNHQPDYVRNDFYLIWRHLVPGGCIGFHDYNFDLPEVTATINELIKKHNNEISEAHEIKEKHVLLLSKKKAGK
jgi:SAM-dependent methyltransferase